MALYCDSALLKPEAADLSNISAPLPPDGYRDSVNWRRRVLYSIKQLWMTVTGKNHPFIHRSVKTDVPALSTLNFYFFFYCRFKWAYCWSVLKKINKIGAFFHCYSIITVKFYKLYVIACTCFDTWCGEKVHILNLNFYFLLSVSLE